MSKSDDLRALAELGQDMLRAEQDGIAFPLYYVRRKSPEQIYDVNKLRKMIHEDFELGIVFEDGEPVIIKEYEAFVEKLGENGLAQPTCIDICTPRAYRKHFIADPATVCFTREAATSMLTEGDVVGVETVWRNKTMQALMRACVTLSEEKDTEGTYE